MAEFDATNGLLRGRNNSCHLGQATFPAAPDMQTHTLCFNKSLQHHRQHSTAVQRLWKAASEVLPLRFMSLCNIPLCQVTHYANALFTVHVTISRHESQWGPGAVASYQERRNKETENKLCKRTAKGMQQMTLLLFLSLSIPLSQQTRDKEIKEIKAQHSEKEGFYPSNISTSSSLRNKWGDILCKPTHRMENINHVASIECQTVLFGNKYRPQKKKVDRNQ